MNQENLTLHYGLRSFDQAQQITTEVCNVLGHGKHRMAINLLLETATAETQLGIIVCMPQLDTCTNSSAVQHPYLV